ncbi:MAG TPA: hypothetical protein VKQ36_16965, partial [Ktedonobacterales bacterium]|nr:hypothetical protein [Ktedonobacterales bacterium]
MLPQESDDNPGLAEAIRCQRDMYLYWRVIAQADGAPLTTHGQIARPLWRRLREQLERLPSPGASVSLPTLAESAAQSDPDEREQPRLMFLRSLLERLGLLRVTDRAPSLVKQHGEGDQSSSGSPRTHPRRLVA